MALPADKIPSTWHAGSLRAGELPWLRLLWLAAVVQAALLCVSPLTGIEAPLSYLTAYWDDFFYYLQIARNLAMDFRSTYDGLHLTNGYHPLWMLVLAALCVVLDPTRIEFHIALAIAIGGLGVLMAHLLLRYARTAFALPPAVAMVVALLGHTFYVTMARHGMEVSLALPLLLAFMLAGHRFVAAPGFRTMAACALLGSLTILARLDMAIAVMMLAAALLRTTSLVEIRSWLTRPIVVALLLGALPLVAYTITNFAVFSIAMPVSGQAKQLAPFPVLGGTFLAHMLRELLLLRYGAFSIYVTHGVAPALLALLALALYPRTRPKDSYWAAAHLALLIFPFALLFVQFLVSDWILWPWYLYVFIPAFVTALAALARAGLYDSGTGDSPQRWHPAGRLVMVAATILAGLALITALALHARERRLEAGMTDAALAVAAFAAHHEGRLAMGDRAARVGFLLPNRVEQLEGLVGSPDLLQPIREQADLIATLRERGIRYYVGTRMPEDGRCHIGEEPKAIQAGPRSPRMSGRFCSEPVLRHVDNQGVTTLIFDVRAEAANAVKTPKPTLLRSAP